MFLDIEKTQNSLNLWETGKFEEKGAAAGTFFLGHPPNFFFSPQAGHFKVAQIGG